MANFRQRAFLGLLPLLLAACSSLSVGVRWADTIALSYADDYFTLRGADADRARKEFLEIWTEARRTAFPQIADRLDGWASRAEAGTLDEKALREGLDALKEELRAVYRRFEPLGQRLVAEQAQKGFARFDEATAQALAKKEKRWADEEERREFADERLGRVVKETVAQLTPEQKSWAILALQKNPPPLREREQSRRALWERFRTTRESEPARRKIVTDFFTRWEALQTPAYQAAQEEYETAMRALAVRIWASATPEQRARLVKNFRARAEELRSLSGNAR